MLLSRSKESGEAEKSDNNIYPLSCSRIDFIEGFRKDLSSSETL
jgi:hypothetical protein